MVGYNSTVRLLEIQIFMVTMVGYDKYGKDFRHTNTEGNYRY